MIKWRLDIFHRKRKNNPKVHMEPQKTQTSQSNLEKEEQRRSIKLPDFKIFYKLYGIGIK